MLAISVWMAVKNALSYLSGGEIPKLQAPATGEEILMRMTAYRRSAHGTDAREVAARRRQPDRSFQNRWVTNEGPTVFTPRSGASHLFQVT